ncbi:transketolase C-terminal domain-containing protein [Parafrankia sp. EUN1f]|uniref:transketolase C-terminal domain-containing protein n=1 Tax=Parafrankia sp. EUN1f TaxID=102897 RepID=UPI0001C45E71|nr:transketolase C-terminal domain-containing protein [Parafrankia sp. EUN1f]EFC82774.1 Transketolase domain protein [Parafrankia sp. EUN1f]
MALHVRERRRRAGGDPRGGGAGWGQGATHSQSPHATFGHYPGLHVAAPASPADAKGLLVEALRGDNPVVLLEHRSLYPLAGEIPEEPVGIAFGVGRLARPGRDVTVVATSLMVYEAERAARLLAEQEGIEVEVVDVRSIRPLDERIICESVARTGRVVVADTSWARYGFAAEVAAVIAENVPEVLRAPVRRVTPPDSPAPVSMPLENAWHPNANTIARACLDLLGERRRELVPLEDSAAAFRGPF